MRLSHLQQIQANYNAKSYHDGSFAFVSEIAHEKSDLLTLRHDASKLVEADFQLARLSEFRVKLVDNERHADLKRALEACFGEAGPLSPSDRRAGLTRQEIIAQACPAWRLRQAFETRKTDRPNPLLGEKPALDVLDYNYAWAIGMARDYTGLSNERTRIIKAGNRKLLECTILFSTIVLGFAGADCAYSLWAKTSMSNVLYAGAMIAGVLFLYILLTRHSTCMKSVALEHAGATKTFTGNKKDDSQKLRNALSRILKQISDLKFLAQEEVRHADGRAWHQGNVRNGMVREGRWMHLQIYLERYRQEIEAAIASSHEIVDMVYATVSARSEFDAYYRIDKRGRQFIIRWDRLWEKLTLIVIKFAAVGFLIWNTLHQNWVGWTGSGVLSLLLLWSFISFTKKDHALTQSLKQCDKPEMFTDFLQRATPDGLEGEHSTRLWCQWLDMAVGDAVHKGIDRVSFPDPEKT